VRANKNTGLTGHKSFFSGTDPARIPALTILQSKRLAAAGGDATFSVPGVCHHGSHLDRLKQKSDNPATNLSAS
jgi:hypothetical protein